MRLFVHVHLRDIPPSVTANPFTGMGEDYAYLDELSATILLSRLIASNEYLHPAIRFLHMLLPCSRWCNSQIVYLSPVFNLSDALHSVARHPILHGSFEHCGKPIRCVTLFAVITDTP